MTGYGGGTYSHWKRLKAKTMKYGHQSVALYLRGRSKYLSVHRLVLIAFVGPPPRGMESCHDDGNARNNRVTNLRWDTKKNNLNDRVKHGTLSKGEKHGMVILRERDVFEIRKAASDGFVQRRIAEQFGISFSTVSKIVLRKTWKHI
jgi:hypothetical protein